MSIHYHSRGVSRGFLLLVLQLGSANWRMCSFYRPWLLFTTYIYAWVAIEDNPLVVSVTYSEDIVSKLSARQHRHEILGEFIILNSDSA